jgi:hypothetical protein
MYLKERRLLMLTDSDIRQLGAVLPPAGIPAAVSNGVDIDALAIGARLEIETGHTTYRLENRGEGKVLISGHAEYCPEPILVDFQGSVGGSAVLKMWRIEPGLKMAFRHPKLGMVRTSRVRSIRELQPAFPSEAHSVS